MSGDYWLGVATLPALALVLTALVRGVDWTLAALKARGLTFEAKIRDTSKISEYVLRNNIWWERQYGPVFLGGWYREPPKYPASPPDRLFTRWVGIGSANGPCVMAFFKRDLEPPAEPEASASEVSASDEETA